VEEVFSFWLKMAPLAQKDGQKLSAITSEASNFFFNSLVLSARKFNGRKVFEKIKVGC
jgi:hypothetical protein